MCGFAVIEADLYIVPPPPGRGKQKQQPCMHRVKRSVACHLTFLYRGYWSLLELLIIVSEFFLWYLSRFTGGIGL